MELLVATWTLRLALVSSLAVAGISLSSGAPVIDAVDRAVIAAFAFTVLGRKAIGWLETPQQRMLRMRARREAAMNGKPPATKPKRSKGEARVPQAALATEASASPTP